MNRNRFVRYGVAISIAILSFIVFIFLLNPLGVTGWVVIPVTKHYANQYITSLGNNDFAKSASSLDRSEADKAEWVQRMGELSRKELVVVRYDNLKIPYDREHMDAAADVTFKVDGKEETHFVRMNASFQGITQACIQPENTDFAKWWNAVQCWQKASD